MNNKKLTKWEKFIATKKFHDIATKKAKEQVVDFLENVLFDVINEAETNIMLDFEIENQDRLGELFGNTDNPDLCDVVRSKLHPLMVEAVCKWLAK